MSAVEPVDPWILASRQARVGARILQAQAQENFHVRCKQISSQWRWWHRFIPGEKFRRRDAYHNALLVFQAEMDAAARAEREAMAMLMEGIPR